MMARLQILSNASEKVQQNHESGNAVNSNGGNLASKLMHDLQQKEAQKAMIYLKELEQEKSKKAKLDQLKQKKEELMLKMAEKERESKAIELFLNQTSKNDILSETEQQEDQNEEIDEEEANTANTTQLQLNQIFNSSLMERRFQSAENGFDCILPLKTDLNNHLKDDEDAEMNAKLQGSDLLWSEMKKQLNMRENLRNKKKELEDLIKNENKKNSFIFNSPLKNITNNQDQTELSDQELENESVLEKQR
jgi:hypothetical protein